MARAAYGILLIRKHRHTPLRLPPALPLQNFSPVPGSCTLPVSRLVACILSPLAEATAARDRWLSFGVRAGAGRHCNQRGPRATRQLHHRHHEGSHICVADCHAGLSFRFRPPRFTLPLSDDRNSISVWRHTRLPGFFPPTRPSSLAFFRYPHSVQPDRCDPDSVV